MTTLEQVASGPGERDWRRGTIRPSAGIARAQRIHVVVTTAIPALGTVLAIGIAARHGVRIVDLWLLAGMYVVSMVGLTVGFHRLFSHRSFKARPWVRAALGITGSMGAQGPLLYWVSNHRRHHQHSDRPGDPHSPYCNGQQTLAGVAGLWHAHLGWALDHPITNVASYCPDLLRDPIVTRVSKHYFRWVAVGLLLPAAIGGLYSQSWQGVGLGFLWGGLVRVFLSFHATNAINSVAHVFGSRPFATSEHSRNNLVLVAPTLGEGWHNNHHAFPWSAAFGLNRLQPDPGWWVIRALRALSLVWDVRRPSAKQLAEWRGVQENEKPSSP